MEKRNSVNLSVNPCKMCMPLGGVMAMKGIEDSIVILHGSQGCSTYIRRHMATHYNEPIDIASSSLTENGTIYGGAANLKKGLKNIIETYHPKVIGVLTTCLSETIGENIQGIIEEFKGETATEVQILPVSTPAYAGTQSEGYYRALRRLVEEFSMSSKKVNKVNIVAASLNPGDLRMIKYLLHAFELPYILLPDFSETLDAPYRKGYTKLPEGGTKLSELAEMGGALCTLEMGVTIADSDSPGQYLQQAFGVPLYKCPIPVGLRNTDRFLQLLSQISGKPIPEELQKERGRYLDAIIDSHKYNGEGRAVIFGEPELVYGITSLCVENGIQPAVIATGSKNPTYLKEINKLTEELEEKPVLLDDTDFEVIESLMEKSNANLMIGDSNGRRIEARTGVKLVRIGFPIHDRMGAQRRVYTGYFGSLNLLDEITNTILEKKETGYRKEMHDKYYDKGENSPKAKEASNVIRFEQKTKTHPCFNKCAHEYARMHIPVAPKCNISCNYCHRKYDCVNESRPGVTSSVLTPEEALQSFKEYKSRLRNISVVGIAGPGDALANFEQTKRSIELIGEESPETTFCLSTNGLMLPFYANEILNLGVSHVTITINTIDPKIGAKLYQSIDYLGERYTGEKAAEILLQNQLSGLKFLTSHGIVCKVNIVYVKGINDGNIEETVRRVKELGATMTNIMPMINAPGSVFERRETATKEEIHEMRKKCEVDLMQMYHCRQCRADAVGKLSEDLSQKHKQPTAQLPRLKFAVASKTGLNVDMHFGHAEEFYIYEFVSGEVLFLEKRKVSKYCTGSEDCNSKEDKISKIIATIKDCQYVLALRIGDAPKEKLAKLGIKSVQMVEEIKTGIRNIVGEAVS